MTKSYPEIVIHREHFIIFIKVVRLSLITIPKTNLSSVGLEQLIESVHPSRATRFLQWVNQSSWWNCCEC